MGKKMRAAVEKLEPRAYALREAVDAVKRRPTPSSMNPSIWRFD